jgi:NAD(P)-dependent dehydrogenase (short-subunit alcohol dehydrogenase family)
MGALDGKVVLVIGGGNGIGRDCALIAAQERARIASSGAGEQSKADSATRDERGR